MSTAAVIILGVGLLTLLAIAATIGGRPSRSSSRPRSVALDEQERKMAAQADIEEHDIEEMVEARNALRERIGKPPIGDELGRQARDGD
jgi:hypothetical protein